PGPGDEHRLPVHKRDATGGGVRHPHRQYRLLRSGADHRFRRFREHVSPGQVTHAWRGDRVTQGPELPTMVAVIVGVMVLFGALITLLGTLGLLRLKTFYDRVHPPTLGLTMGSASILLGSIICFTVLGTRAAVHEVLVLVFATVTTPVTMMLL